MNSGYMNKNTTLKTKTTEMKQFSYTYSLDKSTPGKSIGQTGFVIAIDSCIGKLRVFCKKA